MNTDMSKTNSCNGQWQEPDHFMTKIWFKKWKCYSKIFMRHDEAVADYNRVIDMLVKVPNTVINRSKTEVIEQDRDSWP